MSFRYVLTLLLLATVPISGWAGERILGDLSGRSILTAGGGRVMLLDAQGSVQWSTKGGNIHDAWMLPNGNVLFADGSVTEVSPERKVVFQYKPAVSKGGGVYACQRLPEGKTLIGENSTGRILELDASGKVTFELSLQPYTPGNHHNLRMVRKLANGNYLVCHSGAHLVRETQPDGTTVWEKKVNDVAFAAVRTEKGTTLISSLDRIAEYDQEGNEIWTFKNRDIPGVHIGKMCGFHLLPNGNVAIGVYGAYAKGKGNGLLEITREKRLVWRLADPTLGSSLMPIMMLTAAGTCAPEAALR